MLNIFRGAKTVKAWPIARSSTGYMNASCAHAVRRRARHIGGIARNILARQFCCSLTDGLSIHGTNTRRKESRP